MKGDKRLDLWTFRESRDVKPWDKFPLYVLCIAGFICIGRMAEWWFRAEHVGNMWLYILLSFIFWYGMLRIVLIWVNYTGIKKPARTTAPPGLRVAIFTTSSPGEPLEMFEKTLAACARIKYPHTTYLLDDTRDSRFKECAERNGVVWLELVGLPGAKAGKINGALKRVTEDFILVMDPDHIPFPDFLDEVLGYFDDPGVGFVQVSQAYYNQYRSFTALGAAEQTYGFYGPTQMSLFGFGGSVAIGANCTFRRKALESIGGHGIGLAEDLITSVRIHAQGWKSIYAPIVVSRGLVPEDFGSFCKQQLKWARGVHEVLFADVPDLFRKLKFWQRISYAAIGTYYLVGTTTFFYLIIPFLYLCFGVLPAQMRFIEFVQYYVPVAIIAVLIYLYMQRWLCHPEHEGGLHWRGMVLKFACWPVFFLGFLLSVVNAEIPYIPTAKQAVVGSISPFARPLVMYLLLFAGVLSFTIYDRAVLLTDIQLIESSEKVWGMIAFASIALIMTLGGIYAAWESLSLKAEDPWDTVDIESIG